MIKYLTPKEGNKKAEEFVKKYGRAFIIVSPNINGKIEIANEDGIILKCEVREDGNYIDGVKIDWNEETK